MKYKSILSLIDLIGLDFKVMQSNRLRMYKTIGDDAMVYQKVTDIMSLFEVIYHGEKKYIQKMLDRERFLERGGKI